jgi:antitoxin ParD1/3/4
MLEHNYNIFASYYKKSNASTCSLLFHKWERTKLKLITLYLPETYIKALDQLVGERFYPNRAEAIRVAIRDLISEEVWRRNTVDG